ncbi:hypothetical protein ABID21_003811 [Pseudorhizobium tarimense]|uniref:Uncharacterized protein n=1 Tax=Pseudorhizobium tarimense TaxID=1079109 RepID=A0ABV2HAX9_9HYPH|nr:hypothetical protein [Pseudorhizobium tarimense]MCJ8520778.1 hypothetical protein [Pseudorhizobium tarimense]
MANAHNDTELFQKALAAIPSGYNEGHFEARRWGATVKRSSDGKRVWLFAEDLAGGAIVSFNLYRTCKEKVTLKPCEMSSDKVNAFLLGYRLESGAEHDPA